MNRTLVYLIVLILLSLGGYWLFNNSKTARYDGMILKFMVKEKEQIHKIELFSKSGQKARIEREDGSWKYTNLLTKKSYNARPGVIKTMVESIHGIFAKAPVSAASNERIVKELNQKGVRVVVYDNKGNKLRDYQLGSPAEGYDGTHVKNTDEDQAYVAYLNSTTGYLTPRFAIDEKVLRDPAFFRYGRNDIEQVQVKYYKDDQENLSFSLDRASSDSWQVSPLGETTPVNSVEQLSKGLIDKYLSGYKMVGSQNFAFNYPQKDSILSTVPFSSISVKLKNGKTNQVDLYPRPMVKNDRVDGRSTARSQVDMYYVSWNKGEDFFIAQHHAIGKILWAYDHFYQKGKKVAPEK